MLTAWDTFERTRLVLPDFEEAAELAAVREWAREGRLVCPVCNEKLWLRVGEKRCAHLAHRVLADCPHAAVSLAIIETQRLVYRFFQERIQQGKLSGPIELEPTVSALPVATRVHLILRRDAKEPVAIVLLESGLKPDARFAMRSTVQRQNMILRPVFLTSTLKPKEESAGVFLLSPTQRDLKHKSLFGPREADYGARDALHFIDYQSARWTSLRGLRLEHAPQVYGTESVRHSTMDELLWSESQAEWTHPNEPRAKESPALPSQPIFSPAANRGRRSPLQPIHASMPPVFQPPAWITGGLVCIGCQIRTDDWQTAKPAEDSCVCKKCFAKGVR